MATARHIGIVVDMTLERQSQIDFLPLDDAIWLYLPKKRSRYLACDDPYELAAVSRLS